MKLNDNFVAGLVAGDGSFFKCSIRYYKLKPYRTYTYVEHRFAVHMAEDETKLIEALQKFFGVGKVYRIPKTGESRKHTIRLTVTRQKDIKEVLIPFFNRTLVNMPCKKAKQYREWRDSFMNYYKNRKSVGWKANMS